MSDIKEPRPIIISGVSLPDIGYYDTSKTNTDSITNSYSALESKLASSCKPINDSNAKGIYDDTDNPIKNPPNVKSLDIPFYLAKEGKLMTDLASKVANNCSSDKQPLIVNQIQHLTCQLEQERNIVYDSSTFFKMSENSTVKGTFEKFGNLKIFLIAIFIITMYLVINGFFGSMDLAANIFSVIEKNSEYTISYWLGILLGISLPIIILCVVYNKVICDNLTDLMKFDITDNPYGIKSNDDLDKDGKLRKFDILTLVLFVLLIYSFVAVLFTIKSTSFSPIIYTSIIGLILFIIAIFIYILYAFIPFFNTADPNQMLNPKPREIKLFIGEQNTPSTITSNQHEDSQLRKTFFITFVLIFIMAMLFFIINSKNAFVNGFFGSSAILILPILWVFNFFIAIQYFYIYPLFLIVMRFFRYMIMAILYILTEKNSSLKNSFSDDLVAQLDNFKNYSPTWGLIGVDELKLLLNILGFENTFSKSIISNNNDSKNLSDNKFVSSGVLGFVVDMIAKGESNMNGLLFSGILMVITIIISIIILFGIAKINK